MFRLKVIYPKAFGVNTYGLPVPTASDAALWMVAMTGIWRQPERGCGARRKMVCRISRRNSRCCRVFRERGFGHAGVRCVFENRSHFHVFSRTQSLHVFRAVAALVVASVFARICGNVRVFIGPTFAVAAQFLAFSFGHRWAGAPALCGGSGHWRFDYCLAQPLVGRCDGARALDAGVARCKRSPGVWYSVQSSGAALAGVGWKHVVCVGRRGLFGGHP